MFRNDRDGSKIDIENNFDETLRMSASTAASIESGKPVPDIHPYLEIGKSLQNLRRSVFDMYKDEVTKSNRQKSSPPTVTSHTAASNHSSSHAEHHYEHSRNESHNTVLLTPGSVMDPLAGNLHHTPVTEQQYAFQHQQQQYRGDQARHSKGRVSTPYRHTQQTFEDIGNIRKFSSTELNDSGESEELSPKNSSSGGRKSHSTRRSARRERSGSHANLGEREDGVDTPLSGNSPEAASRPMNFEDTSSEDSRAAGEDGASTKAASAAVEVSHSIAVIVGQHEERFTNLTKTIDYWRDMSTTLSSQLAERDKSYNSKLEYVLAEQENLSGQQQQVLKDITAALAAQQALAAAAAGNGVSAGHFAAGGSPSSAPLAPAGLPLTPDQLKESDALLRQSLEKLDTLIRLTTDLNTTATPMKSPAPMNTSHAAHSSQRTGPAPTSAVRHALRMEAHYEDGALGTPEPRSADSPQVYELPSGEKGQYSPTQMKIISYQDMQHRQDEMNQMQRLYDNLSQQLRRLFEEKTQLMEELAELRKVNMDLQQKIRAEGDWYQQSLSEMKIDFESQLRAAKVLAQEAKEHATAARAAEKKLQESERECNMRIADLDTQLNSRVLEVTTVRTSLSKAQQRIATLQEELTTAVSNNEDNEVQLQETRRKLKELSRTASSKDELITSLQKEVVELQGKIKKPFTTSVKVIENTDKRINYDYEIAMLKDSVLAIQESEAELQKEYLNLQAESKKEMKRLKDTATQELGQANAEHEVELEKLRKELQSRRRHLEQQTRLRAIAEEELADLRVQYVKMEEAVSQYRLDNTEIAHGNELARNQVEELQDKLSAKQEEITKILSQLQRARKRIEKVEAAHDEKDKQMSELTLRQQRLQQSIRSHAEREIDHLQALRHTMKSTSSKLQDAPTLLLKNASPQSATSSPSAGNGPLPTSVRGRKLSLAALEAECDALWEDIPAAVETVINELKQYHNRTHSLSADLQLTRVNSTTMSSELSTHISRQEQEILSLKHEIETREINAKKRLEKFKTSSQAEFTAQIDRLKGELNSMSQQIDALAADKAQQISHLKSERASVQSQLDAALQQVQDLNRKTIALQDAQDLAEKRCRTAAAELLHELQGLPTAMDDETSPGKKQPSPSHHVPSHHLSAEAESTLPPEQLLASAASRLRTKSKEFNKFLKSRRRNDSQQQDAMKTFFESLNSSFISVTQSHRAHLLHDQLEVLGKVESPIKSAGRVHRTDHSHLYNYLCGDDAELNSMLHKLEDNIFTTLQRSNNVETHLIHKHQEIKDLHEQILELQKEVHHEVTHKETLTHKLVRLESNLHEHISEISRTNEEMSEKEQQLLRDRDLLEQDLSEVEERLQVACQRNDQLEQNIGSLDDELAGTQQELRDARKHLDEVFFQLQASQGKLGDMQHELRGTAIDRDALAQRLAHLQSEHDQAQKLVVEQQALQAQTVEQGAQQVAQLQAQSAEQVAQLREIIAEGKGNYFLLETEKGKIALQLTHAEETVESLQAELHSTQAQLAATREQLSASHSQLAQAEDQLEAKLLQIVQSEKQISELCGEVENHSASFRMESSYSRQVKEQLAHSSTALANMQIKHTALQKEFDTCTAQLAEHVERNTHLEAHIDELEHEVTTLKRTVYDLQVHSSHYEKSHAEVLGHNEEYQAQLAVYTALDTEFHEVQHELTLKTEELQHTLAAHADEIQQYEIALQDAAARQRQLEDEQEILSEKLIALATEAAEWPAIQEELQANISVGQGEIKALTAQVAENENRLQQCKDQQEELTHRYDKQSQVLAERERELEETRQVIRELEDQLEHTHHSAQQTHHSLVTVHSTREMLEVQCDGLSNELQQQKQYLSEAQELVRHQEMTLTECAKQESTAKFTIRGLEAERASLREKLDAVTVSCTDAQIELAEKSTTLKLQLEMKAELVEERDRLRAELDTAADGERRMAQQVDRYKLKLEEVTKECNFIRGSVDKKEHTFVSQRNTIRDLREANDELETTIQDLKARCETLESSHHKSNHWETELEACRKQLLLAAQEKEQFKHNNFALTATRRELETATRELQLKSEMERTFRQNCAELEQSLRRAEDANRDLSYRAQLVEGLQRDVEVASASVRSLTSELSITRTELQTVSESLHTANSSLAAATSALNISKEDAAVAKRELESTLRDLSTKSSSIEQFIRQKMELEHRVGVLEADNRELQGKVATLDTAKSELYNRTLETINREKERTDGKIEQLQERQLVLQQQAEAATRESTATRRSLDDALAKLSAADGTVDTLRTQVSNLQQDNAALKLDLGLRARELSHVEQENRELSAYKSETETLRGTVVDLQRQLQHQSSERLFSENRDLALKSQELAALRKELDETRGQLTDHGKYKQQFEQQERERISVLRDLTELKVENERLQSRIKTTQMDMELSQRQFQFSNLMLAGGMRPTQQHESPLKSDRLSSAMENISTLLREKEVAVVQSVTTQQSLDMHVLQLAEAKHHNQSLQELNVKLEGKVEKLREKLESTAVLRSADEHKNATLKEEVHTLNTQLQIKAHDLQLKTQEVEKLSSAKEALERRLSDELRSMQEKWLKVQGDLQKELHVNQTLAFQVEDAKREKTSVEERFRTEILFLQKAVDAAKQETTAANDNLLQVKAQGVNDKERVAILSSKVTEQTTRISQLEGKVDQQADELSKVNSANSALSQKLASAAKQCRDWETQCEQHQGKTDQMQARYEQQTSKCEQLQSKIDAMAREIAQALSVVEAGSPTKRNSGFGMRSDQGPSVEYLVQNLTSEISKYQTVYTEVTERRTENLSLESTLQTLSKQDAVQKSQLQTLSSELSSTSSQLLESRSQLESLQQAHRESETALASLRSINSELEYMCDTMAKELKAAMHRVEELGETSGEQKNEWMRQMEQMRSDAELRLARELAPLQRQVKELSEQLATQSQGEHGLHSDMLKQKAELVKIQQDYESVSAATRTLYESVASAGAPASPSKTPVPDLFKISSPTALIVSLQSTFNEWGRTIHDQRTNATMQTDALDMKNKLIDELQLRVQQSTVETQDCLLSIYSELDKVVRTASAVPQSPRSNPTSPRSGSNPSSPAGRERKTSFSSPTAASRSDSAAVIYQRIVRVIATLQGQYDRSIQAQSAECEKLRIRLAQRERDIESATSIQSSAQQLQMAQQEQQMHLSQELLQVKEQQQAQHVQQVQQLQIFKDSLNAQHTEQVQLLKETQQAQLAQAAQQIKQAQHALNRSLRERTVLQETLDTLQVEYKRREREVEQMGEQSAATQAYWQSVQDRYLVQIAELEQQLQQQASRLSAAASTAKSPSSAAAAAVTKEVFYFEGLALTADQVREKLEELVQYRDSTEQKILDFETLIMTTFYHKVDTSSGSTVTAGAGPVSAATGTGGRRFKSPQQLQFELEDEEAEDDRERAQRRTSGHTGGESPLEPTSPVWRMHSEAQSVRKNRDRLRSTSPLETPTVGSSLAHTASDGLLSGMLLDFHKVLKEHRRLKRLCSSQQVCIMALRLLMKESEAANEETKGNF